MAWYLLIPRVVFITLVKGEIKCVNIKVVLH